MLDSHVPRVALHYQVGLGLQMELTERGRTLQTPWSKYFSQYMERSI
jgi:hypothetical protein